MFLAALRRFALLLLGVSAAICVVSLSLGAIAGASVSRSLSLGFDVVGAFVLLIGFFAGNRGPLRLKSDAAAMMFGQRLVRWASPREREETLNLSALLVTIGFILIVIGLAVDTRYRLF